MKQTIILLYIFSGLLTSCKSYLDLKPDQKMTIPKSLEHADLLLNDYSIMNLSYPVYGEIGMDDFYLNTSDFNSLYEPEDRILYLWQNDPIVNTLPWANTYRKVYMANQVIALLNEIGITEQTKAKYNRVRGGAHFFRAFTFHQLVTVFAPVYNATTAASDLGIPLRLSPDMDYQSTRATMQQTYEQIISDYKIAIADLPVNESLNGRPHKAAAYAGLANAYLNMGDYDNAYSYADSCLRLKNALMNFNELDVSAPLPIARFNKEVLFAALTDMGGVHGPYFARIDSVLYRSYENDDLRKQAFFQHNDFDPGTYAYKGSYDNSISCLFTGLTTSEVFLIRSEAAARTGKLAEARADLQTLLNHRYETDAAPAITENDANKLLELILQERRKELVYRGRRWADLKRSNPDPRFAKTIIRMIDGKEYRLEPNSLQYAVLIPETVIRESGIPQNKR